MNQRIGVNHGKIIKTRNITNNELEIVLQNFFEENTVWDFSYLKTWFKQKKFVYSMYCPCGKIHKPWLEKENILSIIEDILGEIGLCHKKNFDKRVSFFDHLRQKAQCSSIIHYRLMQNLHVLYLDHVETPPTKKVK